MQYMYIYIYMERKNGTCNNYTTCVHMYIYIHTHVHENTLNTNSYDKTYYGEDGRWLMKIVLPSKCKWPFAIQSLYHNGLWWSTFFRPRVLIQASMKSFLRRPATAMVPMVQRWASTMSKNVVLAQCGLVNRSGQYDRTLFSRSLESWLIRGIIPTWPQVSDWMTIFCPE